MSNKLTVPEGQTTTPLKWYVYDQNNSGGVFDVDANTGIAHKVWVQARNVEEADQRAELIGLYFDGAGDCSCCGDRWSAKSGWGYSGDGQIEEPYKVTGLWVIEEWNTTYARRYDGTFYEVTNAKRLED